MQIERINLKQVLAKCRGFKRPLYLLNSSLNEYTWKGSVSGGLAARPMDLCRLNLVYLIVLSRSCYIYICVLPCS